MVSSKKIAFIIRLNINVILFKIYILLGKLPPTNKILNPKALYKDSAYNLTNSMTLH